MKKIISLGLIITVLIAALALAGGCVPTEGQEQSSPWVLILFLVLIFAFFYFVMVRPQRKRQREHQDLMQQLQKGDRVVTAGGIYGVVESLSDDSIVIKVESGATLRIARGSVVVRREK